MSLVVLLFVPLLVALLAAHIDREGAAIAGTIIRLAALLVPAGERADQYDEWMDHVRAAGSRGIAPIVTALSIGFIAAPLIAVLARFDARRQRTQSRSRVEDKNADLEHIAVESGVERAVLAFYRKTLAPQVAQEVRLRLESGIPTAESEDPPDPLR